MIGLQIVVLTCVLSCPVTDSVYHSLTSAFQHWFACLDTVNGTEGYFLSWGLFTREDAAPDGCVVTSVVQTFWNSTAT